MNIREKSGQAKGVRWINKGERLVKNMRKIHPVIIIVTVCFMAFVAGIGSGYLKNKLKKEKNTPEYIQSVVKEEESVTEKVKWVEYYRVMSEDEYIFLYEVFSDNTTNELEKMGIEDVYLPEEEKAILKEGIDFSDKEEALMVMESFIS